MSTAIDFPSMDPAQAADFCAALRDDLTARILRSREERPIEERSFRLLAGYAVEHLGDAENRLRQIAGTALRRTDLPVPDAIAHHRV